MILEYENLRISVEENASLRGLDVVITTCDSRTKEENQGFKFSVSEDGYVPEAPFLIVQRLIEGEPIR
jgi:hypothetical protein